jgi:DivIVA domain-containing protein
MAGSSLALLIATDLYEDATFRQLRAPSADVAALQAVLADPAIGRYEVSLLSNAASHQVNQAIERFFSEATLDDLVLLYFSGHGFKDDAGRLYMITNDSRRQLLASTAVSAQFVREQLDRCRSRRKVVILDCCYAGAFPVGVARSTNEVDVLGGLSGRGCAIMTASSALEYAFESGGSSSPSAIDDTVAPSVFTGALIDGLATGSADKNGDGLIDIDELYDHIYRQVKEAIPQQTPGRRSDVEGTLYVARNPRGPRPAQLPPEFIEAIQHPWPSIRLAVINDLIKFCSGARLGTVMAVRTALGRLAEDDSRKVAAAARSACDLIDERAGQKRPRADPHGAESPDALVAAAVHDAEAIRTAASRQANELTSTTERDITKLRTTTEREVAQLKESAKRERDEILTTSRRQADEMRSQAQRILEESEAQRAQAEAEFEIQLASRREESERQDAERLAAAQAATQELVSEAKQRAAAAEARAVPALREAEQALVLADECSDYLLAQARGLPGASSTQLDIQGLTKQKYAIAAHLGRIRRAIREREPQSGRFPVPEFDMMMRGYSRREVDEYLTRLSEDPSLLPPKFEIQMRGYSKEHVDQYIQGWHT